MKREIDLIIKEIIEEQSNIVGTKIATERAKATKVIDFKGKEIIINSNPDEALKKLINSFEEIFGEASVEVCEEVINRHKVLKK